MVIKIGDLTIKQFHTICNRQFCIKCPLYGGDPRLLCKASTTGHDDDRVEISDELLEAIKNES